MGKSNKKLTSLKSERFKTYIYKNYLSITLPSKEAFATKSEP